MKSAMKLFRWSLVFLLLPFSASFSFAADSSPVLTVRESGVALYSRQDEYADKVATLQKGDVLTPLAEAVGKETWYLVQNKQGLSGWVRAVDVVVSEAAKDTFKEQNISGSTWSAIDSKGRAFEGSFTVDSGGAPDKASGSWTLRDPMAKVAVRGTWTAQKFSTGWSGIWRASVEGQKSDYAGSWTADFPQARAPTGDRCLNVTVSVQFAPYFTIRGGTHYGPNQAQIGIDAGSSFCPS